MPLVRLATATDYEAFQFMGRTMYRVRWYERLCPGNPAEDPITGAELFNEWQCTIAAGHNDQLQPGERLALIVEWCLESGEKDAVKLASEIIRKYKESASDISLQFSTEDYSEPALAYRYELSFLNNQVMELPAIAILQLQNLCKGSNE